MSDRRIRAVAVVGDGVAGWSAAAALAKRVPHLSVAVVPALGSDRSMADRFGGAAPSIGEFHDDIGVGERHLLASTGGAFRLGSRFEGWTGAGSSYVHAYGPHGAAIGPAAFHQHWLSGGGTPAFDIFSPAVALGARGRFLPARAFGDDALGGYGHGLQLDPVAYRAYLRAYARHLGVAVTADALAEVTSGEGGVAGLRLSDGETLTADLYVDATGAEARVLAAVAPTDWTDWRGWLPCDRAVQASAPADSALPVLDRVTASAGGWMLEAALPERTIHSHVYSSDALRDDEATRPFPPRAGVASDPISFQAGRRARSWVGNVVAVGEAAVVVEPLEAAPLHLVHAQVDRLVASLPDRGFAAVELAEYNRETGEEADRLRDFLILHYLTADRPEPFWRFAAATPPLLAETVALFRERGRLPIRDGESFARDSWLAVLLGQGVRPRRHDALADTVDRKRVRAAIDDLAARIAALADAAPPHRAFLQGYLTGAPR